MGSHVVDRMGREYTIFWRYGTGQETGFWRYGTGGDGRYSVNGSEIGKKIRMAWDHTMPSLDGKHSGDVGDRSGNRSKIW